MPRKKNSRVEDEENEPELEEKEGDDELDEAGFHLADEDEESGKSPATPKKGLDLESEEDYESGSSERRKKKAGRPKRPKLIDDFEDHIEEEDEDEEEGEAQAGQPADDDEDEDDFDDEDEDEDVEEDRSRGQRTRITFDEGTRLEKKTWLRTARCLLDLKEGLAREVMINQAAGKEAHQDEVQDLADQAADAYDRELASSLSETERTRLSAVEKALERVEKGSYGVCETCEKVIPLPRLKALPFARLCVNCQEIEERVKR